MSRLSRTVLLTAATCAAFAGLTASAGASFHDIKIRAFFMGSGSSAFIELQMYSDGQNLVNGQPLRVYGPTGAVSESYTLNANVPHGGSQRTILIRDTGVDPRDFTAPGLTTAITNQSPGGAICYGSIDCVSWGTFNGATPLPSPAGTPIDGLSTSQVQARKITPGCATALDPADDTNSSAADFAPVIGFPVRANAVAPTETLCAPPAAQPNPAAPQAKKKKCKKKRGKKGAAAAKCKKKKRK
jgi:hypothetical protein